MAQTIQKTGKGWKALTLLSALGAIFFFGGVFVMMSAADGNEEMAERYSETIASFTGYGVLCLGGFVFARLGAWWFHG